MRRLSVKYSFTVPKNPKVELNWRALHVKSRDPLVNFFAKKIHYRKKTERGDPLGFFNIHSVVKHQKMKGDPLGKFFPKKKTHNAKK